jgi:hypothetical protein
MKFIDFEFTGLDNNYIKDNEIIQVKIYDTNKGVKKIINFRSNKKK